jgi:hypothetical protein
MQAAKKCGLRLAIWEGSAGGSPSPFWISQRSPDVEMGAMPPLTPASGIAAELWICGGASVDPSRWVWSPVEDLREAPPGGSPSGGRDVLAEYAGMREDGWATWRYRFVPLE